MSAFSIYAGSDGSIFDRRLFVAGDLEGPFVEVPHMIQGFFEQIHVRAMLSEPLVGLVNIQFFGLAIWPASVWIDQVDHEKIGERHPRYHENQAF